MIGPTPNRSVRVVPDAATAARIRCLDVAQLVVEAADVVEELERQVVAGLLDRAGGVTAGEEAVGVGSVDFLGDPPGTSSAKQRVEPTRGAVPGSPRSMLRFASRRSTSTWSAARTDARPIGAQRGDRDRQGVVGVVLVRPSRAQHPHPRRQRGRHIDDALAGGDELLGQQIAEPAGGLDRPRPRRRTAPPTPAAGRLGGASLAPSAWPARPRRRRSRPRCATPCAGRHR